MAQLLVVHAHDSLLFFTNRGKVYQLKAYALPDVGRAAKGEHLRNLINIEQDESITGGGLRAEVCRARLHGGGDQARRGQEDQPRRVRRGAQPRPDRDGPGAGRRADRSAPGSAPAIR